MRKIALAGAVLAAALTLGACGDKDAGAPNAQDNGQGTANVLGVGELASAVTKGTTAKSSVNVDFTLEAMGQNLSGKGKYRLAPSLAVDLTATTPEGDMRIMLVDEALYLQLAEAQRTQLGMDKPWVKIDANGTDPVSKLLGSMIKPLSESADVTKQIEKIRQAGTITKTESVELNGQQTVHYTIDVSIEKMMAQSNDELTKAGLEALQKQGVQNIKQELWVDSEQLPVKMVSEVPTGQGDPGKVTMNFSKWGEKVDIAAPPADQVGSMPKLGG